MLYSTGWKQIYRTLVKSSLAFVALLSVSRSADAFPELSRHGYVNCTACHVSPTGGGVLNSYGRELSRELLSYAGGEREQMALHGLIPDGKVPQGVLIGGNIRAVQTYVDNLYVRQGDFILMQAELELAYQSGKWTVDGTFGRLTDGTQAWLGSHRYWGGFSFSDELSARAGRFYPAFGLNFPEHFLSVRRGMGFDEGMETHNLEMSWLGETWSAYATGSLAPSTALAQAQNRNGALTFQLKRQIGESIQLGASYLWAMEPNGSSMQAGALHGTVGLGRRISLMGELDGKWADGQLASYRYIKLGYEWARGWNIAAFNDSGPGREGLGGTFQFFPRPHFQLDLAAEKIFSATALSSGDTFGWLLVHYYI